MVKDFAALVDLWPTKAALSRACGVEDQVAVKWGQRNSIPAEFWFDVLDAFKDLKPRPRNSDGKPIRLKLDDLCSMYTRKWR